MNHRHFHSLFLVATSCFAFACGGSSADSAGGSAGSAGTAGAAGTSGSGGNAGAAGSSVSFLLVDTDQDICFNGSSCGACPTAGSAYFGQDAQYRSPSTSYQDNGDGTVTDLNTNLMWQKNPGAKMSYDQAVANLASFELAGYTDWRLPTIKELYSLIVFSGRDISGCESADACTLLPFIDSNAFDFTYGDTSAGERLIDSQYLSSNVYVSTTMNGDKTAFGVNFADGRIKGYGLTLFGSDKTFFVSYVRGNPDYGVNDFVDNGDDSITDLATGLMWMRTDSGHAGAGDNGALGWEDALAWCEGLTHAGHDDWRLPNAKELQSIVDYSRSPATTNSAAIDPRFEATPIVDEGGNPNYAFYWTNTTHATTAEDSVAGANAAYVAFGEALGWMQDQSGTYQLLDVHGAGSQRSDPKSGNPAEYPYGHGPQGDVIRIYNYARCVRTGAATLDTGAGADCSGGGTGGTGGAGGSAGAAGAGGGGPSACVSEADCQAPGACPPDAALGCTCSQDPQGNSACIPKCSTASDCPSPPGMTLTCDPSGICVPA